MALSRGEGGRPGLSPLLAEHATHAIAGLFGDHPQYVRQKETRHPTLAEENAQGLVGGPLGGAGWDGWSRLAEDQWRGWFATLRQNRSAPQNARLALDVRKASSKVKSHEQNRVGKAPSRPKCRPTSCVQPFGKELQFGTLETVLCAQHKIPRWARTSATRESPKFHRDATACDKSKSARQHRQP